MSMRFVAILVTTLVVLQTVLSSPSVPEDLPSYENPVRSALKDEIKSLPGLSRKNHLGFRQFSGYLKADRRAVNDDEIPQFIHYWFVEADLKNPEKAPLLIWLSGGPGGSSMHGLFLENGPFEVANDGKTVNRRQFSWNKLANVLYLESPVKVGYSYTPVNIDYQSDTGTTHQHYRALQSFLAKFPQYKDSPVFLVGQGYGGDYVTLLAWQYFHRDELKNLKGIAYGDGYMHDSFLATGAAFMAHDNDLINATAWQELTNLCCTKGKTPSQHSCTMKGQLATLQCEQLMDKIMAGIVASGVNPHNIHDKCSLEADLEFTTSWGYDLMTPPGCNTAGPLTQYLNDANVRAALHIPTRVNKWEIFKKLNYEYEGATDFTGVFSWQLKELASKLPILVYNGELDLTCNARGNEWFIDSFGFDEVSDFEPWRANGHVAGRVKRYGKRLTFVEFKDAGKDVPREKPAEAYELMRHFISKNLV